MNHIVNRCLNPVSLPKVTGVDTPVLRCGKCPNCLRQRRNELCVRAYMEFVGQRVSFFTFTYDDVHCPVYHYHAEIDSETGEIFKETESVSPEPSFFENARYDVKKVVKNGVNVDVKRYKPIIQFTEVGFRTIYLDVEYQSINYEDIKKLFKRFRATFGDGSLGKFICVPEYGANGYRPHYHLMVYGLTEEQEEYLVNDWQNVRKYGNVDLRHPQVSDVGKVSAYLAKYCVKGDFDCPYIKQGYCRKCRRAVSKNFGCGNLIEFDRLKKSLLGADFLGEYNPSELDVTTLTDKDISALVRRRCFMYNGFHYPLPKFFVHKIFYTKDKVVYDSNGEVIKYISEYDKKEKYQKAFGEVVKYRLRATQLQKKIAGVILADLVNNIVGFEEQDKRNLLFDSGDCFDSVYITPYEELSEKVAQSYFISELERSSYY